LGGLRLLKPVAESESALGNHHPRGFLSFAHRLGCT